MYKLVSFVLYLIHGQSSGIELQDLCVCLHILSMYVYYRFIFPPPDGIAKINW